MTADAPVAAQVARVARLLAAAGLVEGFGHVSARSGAGFVITSTRPLGAMEPADVGPPGAPGRPLETPLHAALYRARPDVGAICRTHSPAAVAWGARGEAPPLVHGLGGLSGEIALRERGPTWWPTRRRRRGRGRALGGPTCCCRAATARSAPARTCRSACVRAWFLEERARVALAAGPSARPLDGDELSARSRHHPTETARAWQWLVWRFPEATTTRPSSPKEIPRDTNLSAARRDRRPRGPGRRPARARPRRLRRRRRLSDAGTTAATAAAGGAALDSMTKATLVLDFLPGGVHAGIYRAQAQGYYEANNIDLEIIQPTSTADTLKLIDAGQADFGIADGIDLANQIVRGPLDAKAIAAVVAGAARRRSSRSRRTASPTRKQLEGKTVGVTGVPSDNAIYQTDHHVGRRRPEQGRRS